MEDRERQMATMAQFTKRLQYKKAFQAYRQWNATIQWLIRHEESAVRRDEIMAKFGRRMRSKMVFRAFRHWTRYSMETAQAQAHHDRIVKMLQRRWFSRALFRG